jgi:hypothetical protein
MVVALASTRKNSGTSETIKAASTRHPSGGFFMPVNLHPADMLGV